MSFLYPSLFCFLPIGTCYILLVCFGLVVGHLILINISFFYGFACQKKKFKIESKRWGTTLEISFEVLQEKLKDLFQWPSLNL